MARTTLKPVASPTVPSPPSAAGSRLWPSNRYAVLPDMTVVPQVNGSLHFPALKGILAPPGSYICETTRNAMNQPPSLVPKAAWEAIVPLRTVSQRSRNIFVWGSVLVLNEPVPQPRSTRSVWSVLTGRSEPYVRVVFRDESDRYGVTPDGFLYPDPAGAYPPVDLERHEQLEPGLLLNPGSRLYAVDPRDTLAFWRDIRCVPSATGRYLAQAAPGPTDAQLATARDLVRQLTDMRTKALPLEREIADLTRQFMDTYGFSPASFLDDVESARLDRP